MGGAGAAWRTGGGSRLDADRNRGNGPMAGGSPSADVQIANWATALCVTIGVGARRNRRGGAEGRRVAAGIGGSRIEFHESNGSEAGAVQPGTQSGSERWPWKPGTSAWVEPTAHTLVALKRASAKVANERLRERVEMGEAQLMDVRCDDGGWNYGSRAALGVDLPSYPETTALALLGLAGPRRNRRIPGISAAGWRAETTSPMARAWLTVALAAAWRRSARSVATSERRMC